MDYSESYLLAKMSLVAYYDNPLDPTDGDLVREQIARNAWDELYEDGWRIGGATPYASGDFAVTVFEKGHTIVIACRGSDADGDWQGADRAIAGFDSDNWDQQFDEAIRFTARMIQYYGAYPDTRIMVTGHSLGGSLAQVVSKLFDVDGAAFDPGGAANILTSSGYNFWKTGSELNLGHPPDLGPGDNFVNYLMTGSLVSHWPVADHIGTMVELYNGNGTQDELHYIGGIIELMRQKANEGGTVYFGTSHNDAVNGNGQDNTLRGYAGDDLLAGFAGNDIIFGGSGNDTLRGGSGNDIIDGGDGDDLVAFSGLFAEYFVIYDPVTDTYTVNDGAADRDGLDVIRSVETYAFVDGSKSAAALLTEPPLTPMARNGISVMPDRYTGPATAAGGAPIHFQLIGDSTGEVVIGTAYNDFINSAAGVDAVDAKAGNDVIDGGTGSNFLTGGTGTDIFFSDGRGGVTTWSTITDWQAGEQLSVWGWHPGSSKIIRWAQDGAEGYKGLTMHADLNGDGTIDTSVTFTGITSQSQLPTPQEFDGVLWFV